MISCLCDGIFLKRCFQFLEGAVVDHYLLVDSSSDRQIAQRQGPEKLKHFAGKLLWIQQVVMNGDVCLFQVPTMWNIAGVGTKPLGFARLRLLLHLINVASREGADSIGEAEYEMQSQKHGSAKQLNEYSSQRCCSNCFADGP